MGLLYSSLLVSLFTIILVHYFLEEFTIKEFIQNIICFLIPVSNIIILIIILYIEFGHYFKFMKYFRKIDKWLEKPLKKKNASS